MTYSPSGNPATGSEGLSALIRAEFAAIGDAFNEIAPFSATGVYSTVFVQQGDLTLTLPAADGTLALTADVATAVATETAARATAVATETTRAEAAEGANATAITTETARAETAEGIIATAISAETTRAEAAEGANATAISAETTARKAAIAGEVTARNTAIGVETARAEAAEAALASFTTVYAPSKSLDTTYTNTAGKPMFVSITVSIASADVSPGVILIINSVTVCQALPRLPSGIQYLSLCGVVPSGGTYSCSSDSGYATLVGWTETY